MSDLKKYNPPPGSADLYLAASKHFQQAKLILENVPSPDPEVRIIAFGFLLQNIFDFKGLFSLGKNVHRNWNDR